MGPEALAQVLRPLADLFQPRDYPELLIGLGAPDDAAVYRLGPEQALVATADFFPPVVDDPYAFGAIAAANALSDIYAMGGLPLFALNLAAFPEDLPAEVIAEILRGGGEKAREASCAIAGGHTISDREPKYGLAVIGLVHPEKVIRKGGAQPGDRLVLTKPLGSGVITTAHKRDSVEPEHLEAAVASMIRLNRLASQAACRAGAHAMTDITGFGLLGHTQEMAALSGLRVEIEFASLPWLPGTQRYAAEWVFPGGAERNQKYYQPQAVLEHPLADWELTLLCDPETSGGLLIAVPEDHVHDLLEDLRRHGESGWAVGSVTRDGRPGTVLIR